jgi:hypothetical protein
MTATALNRMTKILMTNAYNTLRAHHRVARALTPRQFEVEFWKPPGSVITKPFLLVARWRSASQSVPRIKDSMLTAGLRMRDSAQLQLY